MKTRNLKLDLRRDIVRDSPPLRWLGLKGQSAAIVLAMVTFAVFRLPILTGAILMFAGIVSLAFTARLAEENRRVACALWLKFGFRGREATPQLTAQHVAMAIASGASLSGIGVFCLMADLVRV